MLFPKLQKRLEELNSTIIFAPFKNEHLVKIPGAKRDWLFTKHGYVEEELYTTGYYKGKPYSFCKHLIDMVYNEEYEAPYSKYNHMTEELILSELANNEKSYTVNDSIGNVSSVKINQWCKKIEDKITLEYEAIFVANNTVYHISVTDPSLVHLIKEALDSDEETALAVLFDYVQEMTLENGVNI